MVNHRTFLPQAKIGGRPRTTSMRDVWDAIQYVARAGCAWRMLPNDFPPPSTVQRYFYDWRDRGLFHRINHALVMAAREADGREARPEGWLFPGKPKINFFQLKFTKTRRNLAA